MQTNVCLVFQELVFVGHKVTSNGINPAEDKIEPEKEVWKPRDTRTMRRVNMWKWCVIDVTNAISQIGVRMFSLQYDAAEILFVWQGRDVMVTDVAFKCVTTSQKGHMVPGCKEWRGIKQHVLCSVSKECVYYIRIKARIWQEPTELWDLLLNASIIISTHKIISIVVNDKHENKCFQ